MTRWELWRKVSLGRSIGAPQILSSWWRKAFSVGPFFPLLLATFDGQQTLVKYEKHSTSKMHGEGKLLFLRNIPMHRRISTWGSKHSFPFFQPPPIIQYFPFLLSFLLINQYFPLSLSFPLINQFILHFHFLTHWSINLFSSFNNDCPRPPFQPQHWCPGDLFTLLC